jgi:hypothetical protein
MYLKYNIIKYYMPLFKNFLTVNNLTGEQYLEKIFEKLDTLGNLCPYLKTIPSELRNCTCCERHKLNFPNDDVKWEDISQSESSEFNLTVSECDCTCRYISRLIYKHIYEESSSDCSDCSDYSYETLEDSDGSESLGSEDSDRSEDSEETDSDDSFIVKDDGMPSAVRRKLDKLTYSLSRGKL